MSVQHSHEHVYCQRRQVDLAWLERNSCERQIGSSHYRIVVCDVPDQRRTKRAPGAVSVIAVCSENAIGHLWATVDTARQLLLRNYWRRSRHFLHFFHLGTFCLTVLRLSVPSNMVDIVLTLVM